MPVWSYVEAVPVVKAIDAAVQPHGFRAKMVGSVADYGSSEKDLDITVTAQGSTSVERLLAAITAIEKLYRLRDVNDDVLGFQDDAGRTVEVWLCNIPHGVLYDDEFDAGIGPLVTLSEKQLALLRELWIEAEQERASNDPPKGGEDSHLGDFIGDAPGIHFHGRRPHAEVGDADPDQGSADPVQKAKGLR